MLIHAEGLQVCSQQLQSDAVEVVDGWMNSQTPQMLPKSEEAVKSGGLCVSLSRNDRSVSTFVCLPSAEP